MSARDKDARAARVAMSRWTVIGVAPHIGNRPAVRVRCACGTERAIKRHIISGGWSRSCGCLPRDQLIERLTKHGDSRRHGSLYSMWRSMLKRCHEERDRNFANYGARGIMVCAKWREDFAAFRDDMGPRPSGTTLDRIDNDKGYEPGNCRWATRAEQTRNTSRNVRLTLNGETMCLSDWALRAGMNRGTLRGRLRNGWSLEAAITAPSKARKAA